VVEGNWVRIQSLSLGCGGLGRGEDPAYDGVCFRLH